MKIIYDSDNGFEKDKNSPFQTEDVEIKEGSSQNRVSVNAEKTFSANPRQLDKPQEAVANPTESVNPQIGQQPIYTNPYGVPPITQEQFNFMMAQFAAMQGQQATFPQENPMPGQMPYGGVPYQPYVPYQPAPPQPVFDGNGQNPGTRVLYQSADFDMQEKSSSQNINVPQPQFKNEITFEDIEEESISLSDKKTKKTFDVDETQITMFELNNMTKKSKVPEYKKTPIPGPQMKSSFTVEEEEEKTEEKKSLPVSEIVRRVVLAVSLIAIVIASGMLLNEYRLSKQNNDIMDEVSDLILEPTKKSNKPNKQDVTEKELTPEEQWAKLKQEYPSVNFPEGLQLKYAKLYATNQEFVGYLSADGVGLNLPVVQTVDDNKYLNKNFYLQNTKYGCPFVTHLNNISTLDMNTVIFGHHMNNGTIFGTLDNYKTIEGFKKAPLITFNTLYQDYSWKIIAVILTNAYAKDDNGYIFRYYFTQLSSEANFSAYLSELSQRSLYDTGVDVLPTDKLLTLSTCSHEFTDARFVVIARLVRPGESTDVDTSRATVNSNPRYPQAWYDKKGKTNPYKNSFQWEVS